MNINSYRELKVLDEFSNNTSQTQRHLAKKLGVALGLTNLMIRRCVTKGYVKVVNVQKNRIQYLLTARGIAEKTRLTYEYLEYSLQLYRGVRQVLGKTLGKISAAGGKKVVFLGTGEVAEISYLTLAELGLELIGVFDDSATGQNFLGQPIRSTQELENTFFDCGIVGSLNNGMNGFKERFQQLGLPTEKIIMVQQNGPEIRTVIPTFNGG